VGNDFQFKNTQTEGTFVVVVLCAVMGHDEVKVSRVFWFGAWSLTFSKTLPCSEDDFLSPLTKLLQTGLTWQPANVAPETPSGARHLVAFSYTVLYGCVMLDSDI